MPPVNVRTILVYANRETADKRVKGLLRGPDRRIHVSHFESVNDDPTFDFRSSRFCADARTLAGATGRTLAACRQDLFIAEGDMAMAFDWLMSGYNGPSDDPVIH